MLVELFENRYMATSEALKDNERDLIRIRPHAHEQVKMASTSTVSHSQWTGFPRAFFIKAI